MYEVVVKRNGEWTIVGQYTDKRSAQNIAKDYRKHGEQAIARRQK